MSEYFNHYPVEQATEKPRSGCLIVFKILLVIVLTLFTAVTTICSGDSMGLAGVVLTIGLVYRLCS